MELYIKVKSQDGVYDVIPVGEVRPFFTKPIQDCWVLYADYLDERYLKTLPESIELPERIVCAANIYGSQIIAGVRHGCDVMCDALDGFLAIKEFEKLSLELMGQMTDNEIYHEIDGIIISKEFKDFSYDKECQGFLTSKYRFVDRFEAWKIALRQRQIVRRCHGDDKDGGKLFSENLY